MTRRGDEEMYRAFYPDEAAIDGVIAPHGWERVYANKWRKKEDGLTARLTYVNGRVKGSGDLILLGEAARLLANPADSEP